MNKMLFVVLSVAALCAFQASGVEGRAGVSVGTGGVSVGAGATVGGGSRYGQGSGKWAEGTISGRGADGRLTIRGSSQPYANDYFSYHHDYYSNPDQRTVLSERYRDRFNYNWSDNNATDYTFNVPDYNNTVIYDEPNYGNEYSSWKYDNEPRSYHYGDLNVGDRVVVGYDENGNKVNSMYRVNPRNSANATEHTTTRNDNTRPGDTSARDNTRSSNAGTTNNSIPSGGGQSNTGGNNAGGGNSAPANPGGRSSTGGNNNR